jgi:hypothetical protein
MHPALRLSCLLVFSAVGFSPIHAAAQFVSTAAVLSDSAPQPAHAQLKISLRQPDDTAFRGLATVRLTSSTGAEIKGRRADSDDQTIFPDLAPGSYVVRAVAPGFTTVTETIDIQARHELETIYLVL